MVGSGLKLSELSSHARNDMSPHVGRRVRELVAKGDKVQSEAWILSLKMKSSSCVGEEVRQAFVDSIQHRTMTNCIGHLAEIHIKTQPYGRQAHSLSGSKPRWVDVTLQMVLCRHGGILLYLNQESEFEKCV